MKKILMVTSILGVSVAGSDKIMAMQLDPQTVQEILLDTHGQRTRVADIKEQDDLNQAIALSKSANEAVKEEKKILRKVLTDSQKEYLDSAKRNSVDPDEDSEDSLEDKIILAKGEVASLKDSLDRFGSFTGNDPQLEAAEKKLEALEKAKRRRNGDFDPEQVKKQKEGIGFYNKLLENSPGLQRKPLLSQSSPTIIIGSGSRDEGSDPRDADATVQKMLWEDIRINSGNNSLNNSRNNSTRTTPVNSPPPPVKILNPDAVKAYNNLKDTNKKNRPSISEKIDSKQKSSSDSLKIPATSSSASSSTPSPRRKLVISRKGDRLKKSSPEKSSPDRSPTRRDSISPAASREKILGLDGVSTQPDLPALLSNLSDSQFFEAVESGTIPSITVSRENKGISSFQGDDDRLMNNEPVPEENINGESFKESVPISRPEEKEIDLRSLKDPLQIDYINYITAPRHFPVAQEPLFLKARILSWETIESKIPVFQLFLLTEKSIFTSSCIEKTKTGNEEQYRVPRVNKNNIDKSMTCDAEGKLWLYIGIPMKFEKIPDSLSKETLEMLKASNPNIFFQEDTAETIKTIKEFFSDNSEQDCLTLFARLISFKSAK